MGNRYDSHYEPIYYRGATLLKAIEEFLPRCKDKFVRAKLRNGQTLRLYATFKSVVDPDLSEQVLPDIACNATATKGGEYVTLGHLYDSILGVQKIERNEFENLDAVVLVYTEDVDEPFSVNDHAVPDADEIENYKVVHDCKYHLDVWDSYCVPRLYPIMDIVEKDDGIVLVCYETGLFAPNYECAKYGLPEDYYEPSFAEPVETSTEESPTDETLF